MMLMGESLDTLKDWRQMRPVEYLAPVRSLPDTNYRWLYESGNGTAWSGGVLVEYDGYKIRRISNGV
jgi:hypothetical protein